jgi:hypothetical protein
MVSQDGACLARVMIAVVTKENDLSTDLLLQSAGRHDFSD